MLNYWMLRTYGEHYDPWQVPIKVGMEVPWLVRPADRKLMRDGDPAMLYLMAPPTGNRGGKWAAIFAKGEIRPSSTAASNGALSSPAIAAVTGRSRYAVNAQTVTVRYTEILGRPLPFSTMAEAFRAIGRRPRIISNASPLSVAIEAEDWPVIEALAR